MPDFQDVRIRVEDKRLGELTRFLKTHVPWAKVVGIEVVDVYLALPSPEKPEGSETKTKPYGSAQQAYGLRKKYEGWKRVIDIVKAGCHDFDQISARLGYTHIPYVTKRLLNNITCEGYLKGNAETGYTLGRELKI